MFDQFAALANQQPEPVARFIALVNSIGGREFFETLSGGHELSARIMPSWYRRGHYISPHSDAEPTRRLSFVLHLSTLDFDSKRDSGGQFVWCRPFTVIPAAFNELTLFNVGTPAASQHFVNAVNSDVGARLALSGWFHPQGEQGKDETWNYRQKSKEAFSSKTKNWPAGLFVDGTETD